MLFLKTRKNFAKNYNKLKHNTTAIERNVKNTVNTGLEMINTLEKDANHLYETFSHKKISNKSKKYKKYKKRRRFTKGRR